MVEIGKKEGDSAIGVFSLIEFSAASLSAPVARPLIFFQSRSSARVFLHFILFFLNIFFIVNERARAQAVIKTWKVDTSGESQEARGQ